MKKTAIIYGSSTGTTAEMAERIAAMMGIDSSDVFDVSGISTETIAPYEMLLLGSSTWGSGELQDDWQGGIEVLKKADWQGKTVALFGTGDSGSFSDTFCDAIGLIYNELKCLGATFVGQVDTADYTFDSSVAVVDGKFVGLALDEVNEPEKTDRRIQQWTNVLAK